MKLSELYIQAGYDPIPVEEVESFFLDLGNPGTEVKISAEEWEQMCTGTHLLSWKPPCKHCGAEKCTKNHAEFF